MKLYARDLQAAKACPEQVALFRAHFGDGGTVTLAKVRKVALLFNWDWAARFLLSPASWSEYARVKVLARAEYDSVTVPAWVEYEGITASARAEYERVRASALAERERVIASAWAEYERVKAPALAEYGRVKASAWFAGWKRDQTISLNSRRPRRIEPGSPPRQ